MFDGLLNLGNISINKLSHLFSYVHPWKLVLIRELIGNSFSDMFTTLAKHFIVTHSLSQSPQILRADDPVLTTQSSLRTLCRI